METSTYALLLFGALAGGFVSGLAGFGTALMALGIWLYVLPPSLAVPLVLICSVSSQISTLPTMWKVLDFKLAAPFVIGGLAGMPIGALLVAQAEPQIFKLSVGVMLLVFPAALFFVRKPMAFAFGGRPADAAVGFAGGILGGLAGLSGPLPTLWASVRGWTKDQRRGVFQIFNGSVLGAALLLQIISGFVKWEVFWLALLALPGTLIGAWIGARTYRALSDRNFYDIVLALLFLSGLALVWSSIAPR
ncbi:sulfite exporter TauE/SafE family protein [Bradyrhizobium sp. JYMT SZCCT0180]|uniref:sulfite exporter TauE/SafE family protein n=1 Tax=Bradyrhizobium sp. JYMT SZCCT0180 TaxID=2807666 RepID=UPI001BA62375|nr:sulfite exporter TauE/SafE family protein [Bradyrhizobium sp. JYMT SZCCT0180]MBR1212547.1 sulfite exporter TauE/SafE family protein [Bradyrhizobium sp. JYMT SZCCT0180]